MDSVIYQLCNISSYSVLDENGKCFSFCFLQSAIEIPIHLFLIIVSCICLASLTSFSHHSIPNTPKTVLQYTRIILISTLLALSIYEYFSYSIPPAKLFIITLLIKLFAWSLTLFFTYLVIKNSAQTEFANLNWICFLIFLVIISNSLHLQRAFVVSQSQPVLIVNICILSINILVFLSIIPKFLKISLFNYELRFDSVNFISHSIESNSFDSYEFYNHETCGYFSGLFFYWVTDLMKKARKSQLRDSQDLFPLPKKLTSYESFSEFLPLSKNQEEGKETYVNKLNLKKSLLDCYMNQFILVGMLKLLSDLLTFAGPIVLNNLVLYLESDEQNLNGLYYTSALFISTLIASLLCSYFNFYSTNITLKMKNAILTLIYRKLMLIRSNILTSYFSLGEVINFASTDVNRVTNFCPSFIQFITLPIQLSITLYLLYSHLGISFLCGLIFTLIIIPINKCICNKINTLNIEMVSWKDKRIKLMSEILIGIQLVKMQAWGSILGEKINHLRENEIRCIKKIKYLDAICVYLWSTTPVIISCSTFATYYYLGHELTAAKVFSCLSLFAMLVMPLNAFPWVLNGIIEAWISIKRLQKFLDTPEIDSSHYNCSPDGNIKIICESSMFRREAASSDFRFALGPIDIVLKSGEYIGIIGPVGSGKSSLLAAIAGEMQRYRGNLGMNSFDLKNGFGYISQEPWLQNSTIRDNILFGKLFYYEKYFKVLKACALDTDLETFPNGDLTFVGDRGINLSGGQKFRIALARCIYQDFDLYLIDDPYSSVDAYVAEHIKNHCINGILANKAKIICTNHTAFLRDAKLICVMANGYFVNVDTPKHILYLPHIMESDERKEIEDKTSNLNLNPDIHVKEEEEEKEIGIVKKEVYLYYINTVGKCLASLILLSFTLMQITRAGSDWWLSYWTTSNVKSDESQFFLEIYACIAFFNSLLTLTRAFLFAFGGLIACTVIHKILFREILSSSMAFFDHTSFGRIINRFSSDLSCIDDALTFNLNIFLAQFFSLLSSLAVTIYGLPSMLIIIIPLFIPYFFLQNYYRWAARQLRRLCSASLSPIYSLLSESINGLTTIRSFASTQRFINDFMELLDSSIRCHYASNASSQWLNIRLQVLGVIFSSSVAFIAVIFHYFNILKVDAGLIGLALCYSLTITSLLNGIMQTFIQLEMDMISVERIKQYVNNVFTEDKDGNCPINWPHNGEIIFNNVSMKYGLNYSLALKNISFIIRPQEHIGIIGRTGSGKSSLFQVLFRMVKLSSGEIIIDGKNIQEINLDHLRSSILIVPQDPFLFSGNVRVNLDPFNKNSDDQIWRALKKCHCDTLILSLGGLNASIDEGGKNLSSGQKQLICLTRALLSKSKIICFDEITSNIDKETEKQIQDSILTAFSKRTVLTIAHKLEFVMQYDRIFVMNEGSLVEVDQPENLKCNVNSIFYKLWCSNH